MSWMNSTCTASRRRCLAWATRLGYPETFGDALFFIADRLRSRGATLVGQWPVAGYDFSGSWAVEEGHFLGLMLDEDNQPELTAPRLADWLAQLAAEFALQR
jgi:flavodoxin